MKNTSVIKKVKQLSSTQAGVSLTKDEREILEVEINDKIEVKKYEESQ